MARQKRTTPWIGLRNGIYYAFWYDEGSRSTKRLSLHTGNAGEAEAKFAEFLLKGREIRQPRPRGMTVSVALDDYLSEHAAKNCTDYQRQKDATTPLRAFFGDRALGEVDVPLSQEYARGRIAGLLGKGKRRKEAGVAPATVRRELNVLTAAANHALWMKRTTETISVDLPPERRLGPDDEAPYYSAAELTKIFDTAEGEMKWFVQLLYFTGARRASIELLTREQVKWPQRRILLQKPGKVATKKRQPIVPILRAMEPPLQAIWDAGGETLLFRPRNFYREFKAVCKAVGIDEQRRHPHVMRHTRATHLLQDGKSLYDVAKLLGDTLATVERVYGHHSADHLAASLEG